MFGLDVSGYFILILNADFHTSNSWVLELEACDPRPESEIYLFSKIFKLRMIDRQAGRQKDRDIDGRFWYLVSAVARRGQKGASDIRSLGALQADVKGWELNS